jgi:hypothetical protein
VATQKKLSLKNSLNSDAPIVRNLKDRVLAESKVTWGDVKAIRDSYAKGVSIYEIADMTGMNAGMVRDIALGRLFA